ncbi:MAG: ABC transporter permease, partial [Candidatus Diapherotrites archaeon]|nr:ABC transporter permease [Candidatus Diapherotrites archaeon]
MDLELLGVAVSNLRHQGLRSYLTLLGVIIGIAAIFTLVSIGDGLNAAVTAQFEQLGSNTIFVAPGGAFSSGGGTPTAPVRFSDNDVSRLEGYAEIQHVIPFYSANTTVRRQTEEVSALIFSYDPLKTRPLETSGVIDVESGRAFDEQDVFVAMVGKDFAEKGFVRELDLKSTIEIAGKRYKIVGILKPNAQTIGGGGGPNTRNTVWIPEKAAKLTFTDFGYSFMMVQTYNKDQIPDAADKMKRYFERQYGKDQVSVQTSEQILDRIKQVLALISMVLLVIAGVSLVVGGIGI